jgi:peptide-methionine (S)-S-oxide reductase
MASPPQPASSTRTIVLGGGCFWCLEAVFSELEGVVEVLPGYAGGSTERPSYEEVCTGESGHAEVAQIRYDPASLPLADLLRIFFATHDPTTPNRQGADVGTQYRSIAFYRDEEERRAIEAAIREAHEHWGRPIVTQLVPSATFYPAEEYHRRYFERNPGQGYCRAVIAPKVAKLRAGYASRLKRRAPARSA